MESMAGSNGRLLIRYHHLDPLQASTLILTLNILRFTNFQRLYRANATVL